jgi:hypothetical protein
MAHKPPCGWRSVTELDPNRCKIENSLTKFLDSKVGFMRLLAASPLKAIVVLMIELGVVFCNALRITDHLLKEFTYLRADCPAIKEELSKAVWFVKQVTAFVHQLTHILPMSDKVSHLIDVLDIRQLGSWESVEGGFQDAVDCGEIQPGDHFFQLLTLPLVFSIVITMKHDVKENMIKGLLHNPLNISMDVKNGRPYQMLMIGARRRPVSYFGVNLFGGTAAQKLHVGISRHTPPSDGVSKGG